MTSHLSSRTAYLLALGMTILWLGWAWWAHQAYLPFDVNNTDVGAYLFQAQTFVDGHLWRPTPEPREFFQQWQAIVRDRSHSYYAPGHALILAIPMALGLDPWLIVWLLSGACILLTFIWIHQLTDVDSAVFGTTLLTLSPFFAANGASLLSHSSTLFLTLIFLVCVLHWAKHEWTFAAFLTGISLGLVLSTRMANAAALGLCWLPWVAWHQWKLKGNSSGLLRPPSFRRTWVAFLLGSGLVTLPLLLYYRLVSKNWTFSLFTDYWPRNKFGFGKELGRGEPGHFFQTYQDHDFQGMLANWKYSFQGLAEWLTGSQVLSSIFILFCLLLAIMLFIRARSLPSSLLPHASPLLATASTVIHPPVALSIFTPLLVWPLIHILLYSLYFTPSTPFSGPRYLFELIPVLVLALGWPLARSLPHLVGRWFALAMAVAFLFTSIRYKVDFYDKNASGIPSRKMIHDCVEKQSRKPALIFIRSFWLGHPFPYFLNRSDLKGDILFACDRGWEDLHLIQRHPDRNAYILSVNLHEKQVTAQLIQIFDAEKKVILLPPEDVEAGFFIGSKFTPPVQLKGETFRKFFHPKPEEIVPQ